MGIGILQASWYKWKSACYKPHGSNGNQSLVAQMGIGMLQASWFKWESKPRCSNGNLHSASLIVVTITVCVAGHSGAVFQSAEFHHTELHPQTAAADRHLLPVQQGFFQGRWSTVLNGWTVQALGQVGGVLCWMVGLYRLWAKVCFGLCFLFCPSLINCKRFLWTLSPNSHKHIKVWKDNYDDKTHLNV